MSENPERFTPKALELIERYGITKFRYLAKLQRELIVKNAPTRLFVPNRGQWRFCEVLDKPHIPFISAILAGNGVGKTCLLVQILAGMAWRAEMLHPNWLGRLSFWEKIKKPQRLRVRLVCHADDIKDGGSLYDEIVQWFPKGRYKMNRGGTQRVVSIITDTGMRISIKTHDQPLTAHAGSNEDFVLCNEPLPENIYAETIGRLRGGGRIMFFMTPLSVSAWLYDQVLEDADDHDKVVTTASIWDNCKDIEGTRGHLAKDSIENLIKEWNIMDPDEAEAREKGVFKHLTGRIYKVFEPHVHVIPDFDIPEHWPITMVVDPHDTKPPAIGWYSQNPMGEYYKIAEYPNGSGKDYTKIKDTAFTIAHFADEIRKIESQWAPGQVIWRYMDPNKGPTKSQQTNKTIQGMYREQGINCICKGVNDDLEFGHQELRKLLFFEKTKTVDEFNHPNLYYFQSCRNSTRAVGKYAYKNSYRSDANLTAKIDPTYKDFVDGDRYFAVTRHPFVNALERRRTAGYDAINRGRSRAKGLA